MSQKPTTLDYASPVSSSRGIGRRILYCIGLPLICGGVIYGLGRGGDVIIGSAMAMLGAFLVGFALPVER